MKQTNKVRITGWIAWLIMDVYFNTLRGRPGRFYVGVFELPKQNVIPNFCAGGHRLRGHQIFAHLRRNHEALRVTCGASVPPF